MKPSLSTRLLAFARNLQRSTHFGDLLDVVAAEVKEALQYNHAWLFVSDEEPVQTLRLLAVTGKSSSDIWTHAPVLTLKGDVMLEEILAGDVPVVVEDARNDPRTDKRIVAQLGNRSIINVPLRLLDKPFGALGLGTFGDEGCRLPTADQLDYVIGMAGQISVAASRIIYLQGKARTEREKQDLERRLMQVQRLESLGMLAGGIAHDFNNLLTVILSGAGLAKFSLGSEVDEDLNAVISAAERGRDLTRQLLAMSHGQDLSLKPLEVNGRLSAMIELLRRVFPASIQIDLIQGAQLPLIQGDESQLDQVFMNLCVNARDAMTSGGLLTIETQQVVVNGNYTRTHPWAKSGRYVLVTVTDTGIGMPPEIAERVFEPFFTTKSDRAGTGLGLAVVYGIVRQHAGMIQCYSEPGVGTTFKVYLPVLARSADQVGTAILGAVPSGGENVLVAEDDPAVRQVAIRILQSGGYNVTATDSGAAACAAADRDPFDIVLLDVVMPGMACQETIARLRTLRPNIRFLLASGYTAETNVVSLLREEVHEFLRKPYDPDGLLRAVRRVLDGRSVERIET